MKGQVVLAVFSVALICLVALVILSWRPYQSDPMQTLRREYESDLRRVVETGSEKLTYHSMKLIPTQTEPREPTVETTVASPQKRSETRYLYMLQTESCLSPYLQEVIGDPSICPCDVSVLSFKTKCNKPPPPNVKYIYTGTRTSWGGGRNVLYEDAMKREQVYLYFIIMDDDITIDRVNNESKSNPWRRFEEFLERVEPAAAAIDIVDNLWLRRAGYGREHMGCKQSINESAEYLSVARYDAAFNAFHNKTVRRILPYPSKFDHISWIFSPMYLNIKIEILYAGQSVLHNKIHATNPKHRSYPKHWPTPSEWQSIVDEAANQFPQKYRNSSLMRGWREKGLGHEQWSPTVCIPPPPPKMPIIEFAYIDGKIHDTL